MEETIFSKIIRKEIPADIVFEDEDHLVFLDIHPVNYGHLLVIPKKHYQWIQDMPDEEASELFLLSKRLINPLKKALKADFIQFSIMGEAIPHVHIHLIPHYLEKPTPQPPKKTYSGDEAQKIAQKIIDCLTNE